MFTLEIYTKMLEVLRDVIHVYDDTVAYNLARELSAIYLKCEFAKVPDNLRPRLSSMVTYINTTIPDYSEGIVELIQTVIDDK